MTGRELSTHIAQFYRLTPAARSFGRITLIAVPFIGEDFIGHSSENKSVQVFSDTDRLICSKINHSGTFFFSNAKLNSPLEASPRIVNNLRSMVVPPVFLPRISVFSRVLFSPQTFHSWDQVLVNEEVRSLNALPHLFGAATEV
jgi:hypothetical protein